MSVVYYILYLDTSWLNNVHVNLPAVKRRVETLGGRRTVKKQWQVCWKHSNKQKHCYLSEKNLIIKVINNSGVATGWTGVDMSTPLLLEVVPEIDTNPTSFHRGRGKEGGRSASRPPL